MKITTIGIDLAKNVFQVHGVDEHGKAVFNKGLKREQVAAFFVNLPTCLIGMEACGSAHHWARKLQGMGHTVRLMAPQFVKPYVKTNKNDAADAAAICEAVTRPSMRFVPIKNVEQQGVLALHRVRQGFVKARTAQANQIRGMGHTVRLMAPQFVKPYVKSNKNDAADAEAICEAVTRPTMRFVAAKSVEQQTVLMLHKSCDLMVRQRTMLINPIRSHLVEYGIVTGLGAVA